MPIRNYLPNAIAIAWIIVTPAFAADQPVLPPLPPLVTKAAPVPDVEFFMPSPVPSWQGEFAARYWFASAKTGKSLYDTASNNLASRLTYSALMTNSGELAGRISSTYGIFIKGYAGVGAVSGGHLRDEDFPPGIDPYSSTTSDQHGGFLDYASADIGYGVVRGGDFRVGAFVGYHYFNEAANSYGCTQNVGNPDVCQPAVPGGVEIISQNNKWQSVRLGLDGAVRLGERFTLSAEGAWLPYVRLSGTDSHWLRIGTDVGDFSGPIPENGTGQGYQLEALLSYRVTESASVGVGARYWHMQANGLAHFEGLVVGENTGAQPVSWKTDVYGAFLQGSIKFGPYPVYPVDQN